MGKEQPLVSIVMPVYNAEDTVERAIQSVQKQTYSNWELLAVDDGSSDRSGAICDRCAEKDPPHSGVSYAQCGCFPCPQYGAAGSQRRVDCFSGQ